MAESHVRARIIAIGEPMVEFNEVPGEAGRYLRGYGGDTSNFAIAAARQGANVGYVTRLGRDAFGQAFLDLWHTEGVDTAGVAFDDTASTAIYFVTHDENGHAFTYYRKDSAASRLAVGNLPGDYLDTASFLHISGISQAISVSACDAVFAAVARCRAVGAEISYDPNLRLKLWPLARAKAVIEATARMSDYFVPSLDDAQVLTGLVEPDAIADHYLALGVAHVVLKLGPEGVLVATPARRERLAGHRVAAVDATGAGDCFNGSLIARVAAGDNIWHAAAYANAAAALSTTGYGAVAPLPTPDQVRTQLAQA